MKQKHVTRWWWGPGATLVFRFLELVEITHWNVRLGQLHNLIGLAAFITSPSPELSQKSRVHSKRAHVSWRLLSAAKTRREAVQRTQWNCAISEGWRKEGRKEVAVFGVWSCRMFATARTSVGKHFYIRKRMQPSATALWFGRDKQPSFHLRRLNIERITFWMFLANYYIDLQFK
jgi:hypothetical protein